MKEFFDSWQGLTNWSPGIDVLIVLSLAVLATIAFVIRRGNS